MSVTEVDEVACVRVRRNTFRRRKLKTEKLPYVGPVALALGPPVYSKQATGGK